MKTNQLNETIIKQYRLYLKRKGYSQKTYKSSHALNKLRVFIHDKDFSKITMRDLEDLFCYLRKRGEYSDPYLSSLGTELRRFFKYLKKNGINQNLMYNLVVPAHRRERKNIQPLSIDTLKLIHKRFHPG